MNVSMYGTVVEAFSRATRDYADRTAVIEAERSITYAELADWVQRVANGLEASGVAQQTPVGMLLPNCLEFIPTLFGIWRSGATYVQMSALGGPDDFVRNLATVGATVMIFHSRYDAEVALMRPRLTAVRTFIRLSGDGSPPPEGVLDYDEIFAAGEEQATRPTPSPASLAAIMFTSGSTGEPKAVLIDHEAWSHFLITSPMEVGGLQERAQFIHVAPMSHLSITFILPTFIRGGTNIVLGGFDIDGFLSAVSKHRVTATAVVPTIIYSLLDHPAVREADLSSLQTIVYAGSPIVPTRLRQALAVFGPILTQYYGGIEQGFVSCLRKGDHQPSDAAGEKRLASAGRTLYHVSVRILDPAGLDVPPGTAGEICSRSVGQLSRYFDSTKTAESLVEGWVHTGDIGYVDEAGFLFIVDRKKEMIISGGMNIFPRQIEDLLAEHPAVLESAVFGIPDEKWGEALKAVVVLKPGRGLTVEDVREHISRAKGPIYAPKSVDFVDQIPRTAVGKIDKQALRARYWEGMDRNIS